MKPMLVMLAMMMAGALPVQAGTNYPALADYPAPSCIKPGPKPVPPQNTPKVVPAGGMSINTGNRDLRDYNKQVAEYNVALNDYADCMNAYVANGQADMDSIRDRVNKAVADGKLP